MSSPVIYLDNNATTCVAPEVVDAMLPYLTTYYGNPSSMYSFGGNVGKAVDKAREQVASLIGAYPEEILFTSCGTESDSTAINAAIASQPDKRHIITTRVEHPAVLALAYDLEKKGYNVTFLGVDNDGKIDLNELERSISKNTAIVSIMHANNETGVIFPVEKIAEICREREVLFHTDAVQSVGKLPINLKESAINYLSISGHKLHAPKGIGVLYVKKGTKFRPFLRGGHQENGRRAGTEAVPSIVGLGMACELAQKNIDHENTSVKELRDFLESSLIKKIPNTLVNGGNSPRLPGTLNISFKFVEGEAILLLLDKHGICASSGSACTSGSLEPSHVLRAMGVPFTFAHGSIRFSLSRYTTKKEIDHVLEVMPEIINRLRSISPYSEDRKPSESVA